MIHNRSDLHFYLQQDLRPWGKKRLSLFEKAFFLTDGLKIQIKLRKTEFAKNCQPKIVYKIKLYFFKKFCRKYCTEIGLNCFGPGLYLPHPYCIIVHPNAKIGRNCKIQQGVTIGQTNGTQDAAQIGDDVFIGAGAKILGGVRIADGVAIGANAVVVKDILEAKTTWGGVPAKKISNKGSVNQLPVR